MELHELMNQNPNLEKILKNMPETIKNRCVVKTVPAKSIIQKKDDDLDFFSIICKGEVRIINEFENGNIYVIEKNKAIDFIGEVTALSDKKKTSVTTEAVTTCTIIQLPITDFFKWIELDNNFLLIISKRVANKLYNSSYVRGVELFYSASHLIIDFLINYVDQNTNKKDQIIVALTRQEISEKLGVTIRTVNRAIKKLKDENLISINKGKIYINNNQYEQLAKAMDDRKYL
ncbi:cAMP-binding protein [Gottschalkia purinilytica]|uniref:cAMP-binding protein n=1 Tax=Gottschalkia purinilytica TaxID=1503 RepID=A0A0L0W7Z4_GOTPU|nr:Crp/Fnr family transcriptional regulator [Gottschalkia purinilytica]KNF07561.1 cAMP-binding protein [Gottschalkia purinilytica]